MDKSTHSAEFAILRTELRLARKAAGLTQRDLAARLEVPHSWVAKVESGERRIDVIEMVWLLAACDLDPELALAELGNKLRATSTKRLGKRGRTG
jgi:transcriptional regulator with XRE-family HTH domain